jgi:hypothetical protein
MIRDDRKSPVNDEGAVELDAPAVCKTFRSPFFEAMDATFVGTVSSDRCSRRQ